jgi:hypothetical protein
LPKLLLIINAIDRSDLRKIDRNDITLDILNLDLRAILVLRTLDDLILKLKIKNL